MIEEDFIPLDGSDRARLSLKGIGELDDGRISPTPEDMEAIQKSIHRLYRWDTEAHDANIARFGKDKRHPHTLLRAVSAMCRDMIEFRRPPFNRKA